MPMSTLALLMVHDISKILPGFGREVAPIFLTVIIVMELLGPVAVQWGFRIAGESLPDATGAYRPYKPPVRGGETA